MNWGSSRTTRFAITLKSRFSFSFKDFLHMLMILKRPIQLIGIFDLLQNWLFFCCFNLFFLWLFNFKLLNLLFFPFFNSLLLKFSIVILWLLLWLLYFPTLNFKIRSELLQISVISPVVYCFNFLLIIYVSHVRHWHPLSVSIF